MANWFFCDDSSGAIFSGGIASFEDAHRQAPGEGQTLYVVPDGLVGSPFGDTPDFALLRAHLCLQIDIAAGSLRTRFITDIPGQAQTYEKKEMEARSWSVGAEAANPGAFPFILAEATVRGVSSETVRDEIMAQVQALTPLAAAIEAHRIAAKQAVAAAATLPAIVAAATVDWEELVSP